MSNKIGKETIYVDGRTTAKVGTPGELTYDVNIDQLRSDLNCFWTDAGMLHGEYGLVSQRFADEDEYTQHVDGNDVTAVFSYGPLPEQGHKLLVKKFAAEPLVQGLNDKVNMGDMATVTPLVLRLKYSEENEEWKRNVWKKEPYQLVGPSPIGYRSTFTFPRELIHNFDLQFNHFHYGKVEGGQLDPAPDYLRFVQVVHGPSLGEEIQNYGEKAGFDSVFTDKLEGYQGASPAEMQEMFVQNMSDYYFDIAGTRIEENPVVDPDKVFYDHSFACTHLVSPLENKMIFKGHAQGVEYNLTSNYNYYLPQYEQLLLDPEKQVSSISLPDIYRVLDTGILNKFPKKEDKEKLEDFETAIISSLQKSIIGSAEIFAEESLFSDIILSPKDIETMKEYNKYDYMFPMHAKLRINIGDSGPITKILSESDLEESFLRRTVNGLTPGAEEAAPSGFTKQDFAYVINESVGLEGDIDEELAGGQVATYVPYTGQAPYNIFSVDTWLDELGTIGLNQPAVGRYFINQNDGNKSKNEEIDGAFQPGANLFLGQMASLIAKARISTLVKEKTRTYDEILKGKLAYAETIMYRVVKQPIPAAGTATPLDAAPPEKSYYFFNSTKSNIVEFIDTQVRYGGSYRYTVYAYKAVIGTKYYYTTPNFKLPTNKMKEGGYEAHFDVVTSPSVVVCEIPIYGTQGMEQKFATTSIYDEAPIYPNVDIVPYANLGNKLLINISENVGRYVEEPIKILDEDEIIQKIMIDSQNIRKGKKIVFESEDPPSAYQVFRIDPDSTTGKTKKPSSYADFSENLRYSIELDPEDSANASFVESIQLNRKYYYTFRSIDIHDNISNPSPVYEVELVADENKSNVFPSIRVVNFEDVIKSAPEKSFKRYLHIEPALDQFVVDEEAHDSAIDEFPDLGLKEKKLFESDTEKLEKEPNKFKIRLTSKKTGRKVDINIRFIHEHDFIPDTQESLGKNADLRNNS
jgi:hypothetical protein